MILKNIKIFSVLIFFVHLNLLYSQVNDIPQIGGHAPHISIEKILSPVCVKDFSFDHNSNHFLIIDLWATWCAPCIPALYHLDSLAEKFDSKQITFIAISREKENILENFLSHHNFSNLLIGIDSSMFNIFRPITIPHTILINGKGQIVSITNAKFITEDIVRDFLSGVSLNLPISHDQNFNDERSLGNSIDSKKVLFKSEISASNRQYSQLVVYNESSEEYPGNRVYGEGMWPLALVAFAYDLPTVQFLEDSVGLPKSGFDLDVIVPPDKKYLLKTKLKELLYDTFNIKVYPRKEKIDVYFLKIIDDQNLALNQSISQEPVFIMKGPSLKAVNQPIEKLVNYLSNFMDKPVYDKTGLSGKFNYSLNWILGDISTLGLELAKLGLQMEKGIIESERYVIVSQ